MPFSPEFVELMDRKRAMRGRVRGLVGALEPGRPANRAVALDKLLGLCVDEENAFNALHAVLDLRQQEKVSAAEVEPHVPRLLPFSKATLARARSLQQDSPGSEWLLEERIEPLGSWPA